MLRDAVAKNVRQIHLIEMPNHKSLAALGDKAKLFDNADGDLLLAPSGAFSSKAESAAFEAGGEWVLGYAFDYPCPVTLEEVGTGEWCAYPTRGVGYSYSRDVAETVCAVSFAKLAKHIHPVQLLQMPTRASLEALDETAGQFADNGDDPDGDAWLAPISAFSAAELIIARNAGGSVVDGYAFWYPRSAVFNPRLRGFMPGEVKVNGWCGYNALNIGYALSRDVAEAVCAASIAQMREEN
jgi:hypothetical protein